MRFAAAALILLAAACAQERALPELQDGFTRVATWQPIAAGFAATPARENSGDLTALTTSATQPGYQAQHTIATNGRTTLILRYDATISGGPALLGVLAGDRSRWLANATLTANDRSASEERIVIEGDTVHLVLQVPPDAAQPVSLVIHDLQYALQ